MLIALAVLIAACGSKTGDPSAGSGVPRDVFQAIDDHVRNTGLNGATGGSALAGDCTALAGEAAICIDAGASTVLASEATVRLYDNFSGASWDVSLVKRDEGWLVTNVADVGPR
jgi:hypothetical protein